MRNCLARQTSSTCAACGAPSGGWPGDMPRVDSNVASKDKQLPLFRKRRGIKTGTCRIRAETTGSNSARCQPGGAASKREGGHHSAKDSTAFFDCSPGRRHDLLRGVRKAREKGDVDKPSSLVVARAVRPVVVVFVRRVVQVHRSVRRYFPRSQLAFPSRDRGELVSERWHESRPGHEEPVPGPKDLRAPPVERRLDYQLRGQFGLVDRRHLGGMGSRTACGEPHLVVVPAGPAL